MLRSTFLKAVQTAKPFYSHSSLKLAPVLVSKYSTTAPVVHDGDFLATEARTQYIMEYLRSLKGSPVAGYETRRLYQLLHELDAVPEPELVCEFMHACRGVNDFALAIRILESVKRKCGRNAKIMWPYICQEIRPTLDELGIPLPEEMGYDKPELYLESVFDIH